MIIKGVVKEIDPSLVVIEIEPHGLVIVSKNLIPDLQTGDGITVTFEKTEI